MTLIYVLGPRCAGKTTLIRLFEAKFPGFIDLVEIHDAEEMVEKPDMLIYLHVNSEVGILRQLASFSLTLLIEPPPCEWATIVIDTSEKTLQASFEEFKNAILDAYPI